jgi:hypothetical protein
MCGLKRKRKRDLTRSTQLCILEAKLICLLSMDYSGTGVAASVLLNPLGARYPYRIVTWLVSLPLASAPPSQGMP